MQEQERDENFHSLPCWTETSLAKTWILQGLVCPLHLDVKSDYNLNSLRWEMFYQLVL